MINTYYNKTATRTRKSVSTVNDYGEPTFNDNVSSSFDCALQPDDGSYVVEEPGKILKSTHRLYCDISVDVIQGDTVTVDSINYRVLAVMDDAGRNHHLKIMLEVVS